MHGLIAVIISYFIGGFLTAGVIASLKRVDLSKKGSGNLGATNAFRVFGPFLATLVLLGDIAKGVLGVWVGLRLGSGTEVAALCGLAVIVGHNWPLFFGFQGGKGIATTLGAMILLVPQTIMVVIPLWALVVLLTRYVSLASLVAAVALPVTTYFFYPGQKLVLLFAAGSALLALYRHQENIRRLLAGKEHKIQLLRRSGREDK
ncbi:MAG TPA: glycerol-3-phosphate 1-O-acyltransferase PlsY [Firmicutes bacterium]|nr:glycerol-3-phosphate 1-O-acyltransferase PlsY [Bacillota bacterium]